MSRPNTSVPDLVGTSEVATILGKSRRTVVRMVEEQKLIPAVRAGVGRHGSFMFERAYVEREARRSQKAGA